VKRIVIGVILCLLAGCASTNATQPGGIPKTGEDNMTLGNFSVSLAVKDIAASRAFYEKLGFRVVAGDLVHFSIMQNDTSTIGLFQGLFQKNILTYNPGWDRTTATLSDFDDVREIQRTLVSRGIKLATTVDESTTGPASITLYDPDGNQITIDQHVPSPRK
jgi:catechol 2,3-dioxygenase-like lactoylglutathione lyase family enzyme